jgi:hypothetical protein
MKMWFKNTIIFISVLISISDLTFAQQPAAKKDSTLLYKKIEAYSGRSKFTEFIHGLVFKPVVPVSKTEEVKRKGYKKLIQKPYRNFEGKIIRNIDIVTLDPFGYSATDTSFAKQRFLSNIGNKSHVKSQEITIRNLLLIRKNDPFNSLLVKESERLIRSQIYVHDVSFYVVPAGVKSDSVDIKIRELDTWSIIPRGSISKSHLRVGITEKNFLGLGHEFGNIFERNLTKGISTFSTNYYIPNIRNTYISSTLHYGVDGYNTSNRSFAVDRPFYSPIAKWAAGVSFSFQTKKDSLKNINLGYDSLNMKFRTQDWWAGKAIRIFKGRTGKESITNLILTLRYLRIRYSEKPNELYDPLHFYSDEDFYLGAIGISTRKYVQDKYIFRFGVVEDVPVGKVYELTGGYQVKNNSGRLYLGIRYSIGNYYEWGYLSSNFEYGTFFHASHTEQGVFTAGLNYFTGLIEIGKWRFRQFVKPQVTIGMNRFSYDSLTLKPGYGLDGFNSSGLTGINRMVFTMQTQAYSPWNLIGFNFGPCLIYSLGFLGDQGKGFKSSKVYSQLGFGVLIKNENLVFGTFQISISFYPLIPGIGQDVFKFNAFNTTGFGFRDFVIGKPVVAIYQ